MAKLEIIVSENGVESMTTRVNSVGDGVAAGQLSAKTALAVRLLHEAAKSTTEEQAVPISYFDSVMGSFEFRCACGRTFRGPWEEARYEAIGHVELHHASSTIKRDLDALEDTIECLITPSPLSPWSNETLPVKSFGPDLIAEFAQLYADCDKPDFGNTVTKEHRNRAIALVEYLGWDKMKGLCYRDFKEQIVLRENASDKKIYKPMHEDFLAAFALLLRQVGGVLKEVQ
jgi:hypothetical protein